jgi:hypothetical protein
MQRVHASVSNQLRQSAAQCGKLAIGRASGVGTTPAVVEERGPSMRRPPSRTKPWLATLSALELRRLFLRMRLIETLEKTERRRERSLGCERLLNQR